MGGAITAFRMKTPAGALDLLRSAGAEAIAQNNALDSSCYPLVPYSNRIAFGKLRFRGREWLSKPTFEGHPHTLHGHGFTASWSVEDRSATSARIAFEYEGPDFPSRYRATEELVLSTTSLSVELGVENTGKEAMPVAVGFHPFFPKPKDTRLEAPLDGVWLMAANDGIPTELAPLPSQWDFRALRTFGDVTLDHCFTGWTRQALIDWPSRGCRVRMRGEGPLDFLVIYSPEGQDFFCVEPVTNMNDAFNRAERGEANTGTRVIEPGQRFSARMVLEVERG